MGNFLQDGFGAAMSGEAEELEIYVVNNSKVVGSGGWYTSVWAENAAKKIGRGVYDSSKIWKLWLYMVDRVVKSKDFKIDYGDWKPTKAERIEVAKSLGKQWEEEYRTNGISDEIQKLSKGQKI